MASGPPWTDDENAVLERYAEQRDWLPKAMAELPDRTEKATRSRMQKVRIDMGLSRSDAGTAWIVDAIAASHQLLAATLRVGTWA